MTPEKQRIAIAEACGYNGCTDSKCDVRKAPHLHHANGAACFFEWFSTSRVPDYLNDLNAMAGAVSILIGKQREEYVLRLCAGDKWKSEELNITDAIFAECATATQRAEAFLRTLSLWNP